MSVDRASVLVHSPSETQEAFEVSADILSQSGVFSTASEAGDVLQLPITVTRTEFQEWVDAVIVKTRGGVYSWDVADSRRPVSCLCTILKVADLLKDVDCDYWVNKLLRAFGKLMSCRAGVPVQSSVSNCRDQFLSLPEHLQHKVYKAAALEKYHSMKYLATFLHVLPKHLHLSIISTYISPGKELIIPSSCSPAVVPYLNALKHLDSSEHQIDQLIESRSMDSDPKNPTAQDYLQDPYDALRFQQAAIAVEMSSALRQRSSLECLSLIDMVHHAPAAALSCLPPAIANLTCLRSLCLGSHRCPVASAYLVHLESMLQPLSHLRKLELWIAVTLGLPKQHQHQLPCQPDPTASSSAGKRKASAPGETRDFHLFLLLRGLAAAPTVSDLVVVPMDQPISFATHASISSHSVNLPSTGRPAKVHRDSVSTQVDPGQSLVTSGQQFPAPAFQWMSSCHLKGSVDSGIVHMMMHGLNPALLTDLSILWGNRRPGYERLEDPGAVFSCVSQCRHLISLQMMFYRKQEEEFGPAIASAFASMEHLESVVLVLNIEYIQQCLPTLATTATRVTSLSLVCLVEDFTASELNADEWGNMCGCISRLPLVYLVLAIKQARAISQQPQNQSPTDAQRRALCFTGLPGLSALKGLTSLRHLGLKGWASAFGNAADCEVLGEMQQLESVCLDVGPPRSEDRLFAAVLSALPKLSNVRLELQSQGPSAATEDAFVSRFCSHCPPNAWSALRNLHVSADSFNDACMVARRASGMPALRSLNIGYGFNPENDLFAGSRRKELARHAQSPELAVTVYTQGAKRAPGLWTNCLWPPSLFAGAHIQPKI